MRYVTIFTVSKSMLYVDFSSSHGMRSGHACNLIGTGLWFHLFMDLHSTKDVEAEEDEMHNESHPFGHGVILVNPYTEHNLEVKVNIKYEESDPVTELFSIFPHSNDTNEHESSKSVTDLDNPCVKERVHLVGVHSDFIPVRILPS